MSILSLVNYGRQDLYLTSIFERYNFENETILDKNINLFMKNYNKNITLTFLCCKFMVKKKIKFPYETQYSKIDNMIKIINYIENDEIDSEIKLKTCNDTFFFQSEYVMYTFTYMNKKNYDEDETKNFIHYLILFQDYDLIKKYVNNFDREIFFKSFDIGTIQNDVKMIDILLKHKDCKSLNNI